RSLMGGLGQPIRAPQGNLKGFRDREVVLLPQPFGRRAAFNFESPEYDLFPGLLGVRAVSGKVAFELRPANYTFFMLSYLPRWWTQQTIGLLERAGSALSKWGSAGAVVMTELFYDDRSSRRAALLARAD